MRSSESANRPRIAISAKMKCQRGRRKIVATTASQNAISSARQRARAARRSVASSESGLDIGSPSTCRRAGEQALRTPDENDDHDRVDEEGPEIRHVVFAGDVTDAENERSDERPGDARGAADRHHDQEIDHVFERKNRLEPEDFGTKRAAQSGEPGTGRKRHREYGVDVD